MLRLFIRAARALKVGKNQNLTAREAGCEGSVRTGYDYVGREIVTPKYLKSGIFGKSGILRGVPQTFLFLYSTYIEVL